MRTIMLQAGQVGCRWLVAGLISWAGYVQGVTFSVSPSSIDNTYAGNITIQISGLNTGETVAVDRYLDADTNGVINAGDWLVQSFQLTDGQAALIGGVTNINVPGDSSPTKGAITTQLSYLAAGIDQKFIGTYLFRLSSPIDRFPALATSCAVTNAAYEQWFTGKVQCNGTNVPYAGVMVFPPPSDEGGSPIAGTVADGSGSYTIRIAPGDYQLWAFKSNYVYDMRVAPLLTLGASASIATNLSLIPAAQAISGRFVDAANTNVGLPGILVCPSSTNNLIAIGFSGTNGNFNVPVTESGWEVGMDDQKLPSYGYLSLKSRFSIDTTTGSVSGVTVAFPKGTALFYGNVKDDQNHPLPGIPLWASDDGDQYDGGGVTDSNGDYAVAVLAGAWGVGPENSGPGGGSYVFSGVHTNITDGQAVRVDFMGFMGVTVSGRVWGDGIPVSGVNVQVGTLVFDPGGGWNWQQSYCSGDTDSNGTYSVTVPPGTNYYAQVNLPQGSPWLGQFYSNATEVTSAMVITAQTNAQATNINFDLQRGAVIAGRVWGNGSPLENVHIEAGVVFTNNSGDLEWDHGVAWGDTDVNGDYTLITASGAMLVVNAHPPDGSGWVQQYYSNATDVAHATLVMPSTNAPATNINFNLLAGAQISGQVTDLSGNPLGNISVEAAFVHSNYWGGHVANTGTDSNGWYSLIVAPGSNYCVGCALWDGETSWLAQYYSNTMDLSQATLVTVSTDAPATGVDFVLAPAMVIEGWIVDASNHPPRDMLGQPVNVNVQVGTRDGEGNWTQCWETRSDADGYYRVKREAGVNHIVRISDSRCHEVYFHDKLSPGAADVISAGQGQTVSNVNFKLYDPVEDSDRDGLPDYIEGYVAGTDPYDSNDCLRCVGMWSSNGRPTLVWHTVSGKVYHVERSINLLNGTAWTNLTPQPVTASGDSASLVDSNAPPHGCYRVLIPY